MVTYIVNVNHRTGIEELKFGEDSKLDILKQLAQRPNHAEEFYTIHHVENGKSQRSEQWTPAHVKEYLELIVSMAEAHNPLNTISRHFQ